MNTKTRLLVILTSIIYANSFGQFGSQQNISTSADGARSVYAADIDGDGFTDVLSTAFDGDEVAWYKNDGQGNFGAKQLIGNGLDQAVSVQAADIDGDGDLDVIAGSSLHHKIVWYENLNGQGSFSFEQAITVSVEGIFSIHTANADGAVSVFAADLDGDGDMDVLSASILDDKIVWYENTDGQGNFIAETITTNADGAISVFAAYIDEDYKIDVLSASSFDDKIAWYQNIMTLSVDQNTLLNYTIFPNPTKDILEIKAEEVITKVSIYNQLGQEIKIIKPLVSDFSIDLNKLISGIYIIKLETNNKVNSTQIIKM